VTNSSENYPYLDAVGAEEQARLDAVRRYRLVDQPVEDAYDRIAFVAGAIFDAPIATVSPARGCPGSARSARSPACARRSSPRTTCT
jgi:hypothetical protein